MRFLLPISYGNINCRSFSEELSRFIFGSSPIRLECLFLTTFEIIIYMKESLSISNLGPIKHVELNDLGDFIVLIGESGSGKSTIMKVLGLFRWLYKMQNIRSYLKHSNISKSPFKFRMETYLKNCGLEEFVTPKTSIIYRVTASSDKVYDVKFANGRLSGTSNSELIYAGDMSFIKISFISETRNIIPLWADKGAQLAGGYLGFYFHEVYNDFELATNALKDFNIPFLNLKFAVRRTSQGKKFMIESAGKNKYEINFKNSSSGTQTSIPISILADYFSSTFNPEEAFNRSLFKYLSNSDRLTDFKPVKNLSEIDQKIFMHIEEPELSLFPDAQCMLISSLVEKCFQKSVHKMGIILSTHSPYIVNHLNLLIKSYDTKNDGAGLDYEKVNVYQVVDGEIFDLKIKNQRLINTNPLSETIDNIYKEYNRLA